MLSIKNLKLFKPKNKGTLLQIDELELPSTGMILLLGKNGSGKTTFLKSICGLHSYFSGKIYWKGKELKSQSFMERKGQVRYAAEPWPLPEFLTLKEYIQLGEFNNPDLIKKVIERLGISDLAEQNIARMSKGQQQKAMLAKVMFSSPELLLLDEPTNFLDYNSEKILWKVLEKEAKSRLILCTIHSPQTALNLKCDLLLIHNSQLSLLSKEKASLESLSKHL